MALIKCGECGREVSTTAKVCPQCGAKVKKSQSIAHSGGADPVGIQSRSDPRRSTIFALFKGL
jgi:predicted amidophosphoribosyltransferase